MHINAVSRACGSSARQIESAKVRERNGAFLVANDAADACICDVNSAVVASPDRPGATPPRTLSDYFTVNSPLSQTRACSSNSVLRASHLRVRSGRSARFFTRARRRTETRGIAFPRNEGTARLTKTIKHFEKREKKQIGN